MKIGLVDLSSIFWKNWHATKDQPIGSAFENSVRAVSRFAGVYDHVAVCLDSPPYKRSEISADYKAHRVSPEANAVEQLTRVKERIEQDGFPLFAVPGAEADDVIATIVTQLNDFENIGCAEPVESIDILTGDKDLWQLVDNNVCVITSQKGDVIDVPKVAEKFGVMPTQMHDLLALMGDSSDNIPGVKSVGPVRAAQLLKMFGSVPDMVTMLRCGTLKNDYLPPAMADVLRDSVDQLEQSYELVRLDRGLEIDLAPLFAPREPKPLTEDMGMKQTAPVSTPTPTPEPEKEQIRVQAQGPWEPPVVPGSGLLATPTQLAKVVKPNVQVITTEWHKELEPRDGQGAFNLACTLHDSRLYAKNFGNAPAILAVILRGRALGLDATTALEGFYFDEKTCSLLPVAAVIIGMAMRSDLSEYFRCVSTDDKQATYETKRVGDPPTSYQYTINMADNAELLLKTRNGAKTNWHKRPDAMLRKTAGVNLARIVYPDLIKGLYSHEEMEGV